jgi:hypothetical protein
VAGNRHRQRIGGAGPRDRTHRLGRTDAPGDLRVTDGLPRRHIAQRLPDALLKGCSTHIQRQIQALLRHFHQTDHLGHQLLKPGVPANQHGLREPVLHIAHQRIRIVSQQDGADAPCAGRHQDRPQGTLAHRKTDGNLLPSGTVGGRCHPQQLVRLLVEATVGVVARPIDRFCDRAAPHQFLSDLVGAVGRRVGLGRDTGHGLEHPVHVESAHLRHLGQRFQAGRGFGGGNETAQLCDQLGMLLQPCGLVRLAALAWAKACLLCRRLRRKEPHILGARRAGSARRAAIDPSRFHRVPELPIGLRVVRHDRRPAGIGQYRLCAGFSLLQHG